MNRQELSKRADKARQGILRRRLVDLSVSELDRIQARLDREHAESVEQMEKLHGKSEAMLAEGDLTGFEDAKQRALDIASDITENRDRTKRVYDARQERLLNDRLVESLGGKRRLAVLDAFIMTLIVVVVTFLITMEVVPMEHSTIVFLEWADVGACVIFLIDFFWRHRHAESKKWFWRRFWLDFVTSIPIPSAQALRLGRAVRLARLIRVMQLARILRIVLFFWRGMDKLVATFDVKMMRRSMRILILVLILGGIGIWMAEGNPQTEGVESLPQGLWWSFTTVVTGGFGDIHNPQTMAGRALTIGLIIAGMVVVGIFTATLTSLLVRENDASGAVADLEERVLEELAAIRARLDSSETRG